MGFSLKTTTAKDGSGKKGVDLTLVEGGEQTAAPKKSTKKKKVVDAAPDASEITRASPEDLGKARFQAHFKKAVVGEIQTLMSSATALLVPGQLLGPEHLALAILNEKKIDTSAVAKTWTDAASAHGEEATFGKLSKRVSEVIADVAINAGNDAPTTQLLIDVLRTRHDAFVPQFIELLARTGAKSTDTSRTSGTSGATGADAADDKRVFGPLGLPTLDKLGTDMVIRASEKGYDPVVGRSSEMQRVLDVLGMRKNANPVLIGPAGVGKTAIIEGIATMIATGEISKSFGNARIYAVEANKLKKSNCQGGQCSKMLNDIEADVRNAATNGHQVFVFVDEVHRLWEALGDDLKTYLSSGTLRLIGACTDEEWKRYFEEAKDSGAAKRRFVPVKIGEPAKKEAREMIQVNLPELTRYHGAKVTASAGDMAQRLATHHPTAEHLPASAIGLIELAASRVKREMAGEPASITMLRDQMRGLELAFDAAVGDDKEAVTVRKELAEELESARQKLADLETQAAAEWTLVSQAIDLGEQLTKLKEESAKPEEIRAVQTQIDAIDAELSKLERRLYNQEVDALAVASWVSESTGIPVHRLTPEGEESFENIERDLNERVYGQEHMVEQVAIALVNDKEGLRNPNRPIGNFLFLGPSGVGKTELAKAVADMAFSGNLIHINCNEMPQKHQLTRLTGSPPSYVGYGDGVGLPDQLKRAGYRAVVLLDEVEKAHPDIFKLLMQVMNEGTMADEKGRPVDFKNVLIIMTANIGLEEMKKQNNGEGGYTNTNAVLGAVMEGFQIESPSGLSRDEIRNRITNLQTGELDKALFNPLAPKAAKKIVTSKFGDIADRLFTSKGKYLGITEGAENIVRDVCFPGGNGRGIEARLDTIVLNPLSQALNRSDFKEDAYIMLDTDGDGGLKFRVMDEEKERPQFLKAWNEKKKKSKEPKTAQRSPVGTAAADVPDARASGAQ